MSVEDVVINDTKFKRVQLDFTESSYENLQALKKSTGAAFDGEVVSKALAFYDCYVEAMSNGFDRIQFVSKQDHVREVKIIFK